MKKPVIIILVIFILLTAVYLIYQKRQQREAAAAVVIKQAQEKTALEPAAEPQPAKFGDKLKKGGAFVKKVIDITKDKPVLKKLLKR